jgi:predicted enzyme related to lactoylglutathione lyase
MTMEGTTMDFSEHTVGSVSWIDLGVIDPDAACAYYSRLFGWTIGPPDEGGYRLARLHGRLVAAFGPAEDPGPPYWTTYVSVSDIHASVNAAAAAGGAIVVPPTSAGDVGDFAVTRDPAGTPLSFWQRGTRIGDFASGEHGTFAQVRLRSRHPELAGEFLNSALSWRMRPDGTITRAGRTVATWLLTPDRGRSPQPSRWLVHFTVTDVAAAVERALRLGARQSDDEPNVLIDPAGAHFGLLPTIR